MTSPVTASRVLPVPTLRRASEIVLVAGTVIAVIAAFGPSWVVRVGIAVAVAAAIMACVFAWQELFAVRRDHARAMLRASQEHGRSLTEERERSGVVVATLAGRVRDAGVVIERQRVTIAELRVKISGLRGDKAYLRAEVDHREGVISSLRDTVRAREAELNAIQTEDGTEAEVHELPRPLLAAHESTWEKLHSSPQGLEVASLPPVPEPAADDLWTDGSHPTVVDLKVIDAAMILPNYEEDRRVG